LGFAKVDDAIWRQAQLAPGLEFAPGFELARARIVFAEIGRDGVQRSGVD